MTFHHPTPCSEQIMYQHVLYRGTGIVVGLGWVPRTHFPPLFGSASIPPVEDILTSLSHFHYGNGTEVANEPVAPASEQNHMDPSGQF